MKKIGIALILCALFGCSEYKDKEVYVGVVPPYANPAPQQVILIFTIQHPAIRLGDSVGLTWSTTNAYNCTASGENIWTGGKNTYGTDAVVPQWAGTHTYVMGCSGPSGSVSQQVTIIVW